MGQLKSLLPLTIFFWLGTVWAEPEIDPFAEDLTIPGEEGPSMEGDESIPEEEAAPERTWQMVEPLQARVALRGDRVTGLGTLAIVRDRPVIVTSLRALDGNSQLDIRLPNGRPIAPVRIVAATSGSLALIEIDDPDKEFAYIGIDLEERTDLREGQTVAIPIGEERATAELLRLRGTFFPLNRFTGEALAGSPVVTTLRGHFGGVFVPERRILTLEQRGAASGGSGILHEPGVEILAPELRWEVIEWVFFRDQRRQLDEFAAGTRAVAGFLANRPADYASVQPLVAAQRRFAERRSQTGFDLARERDSFLFTIASQASAGVPNLERNIFQLYSYFQPEAELLLNERRRIVAQVQALRQNPASVDRFAR